MLIFPHPGRKYYCHLVIFIVVVMYDVSPESFYRVIIINGKGCVNTAINILGTKLLLILNTTTLVNMMTLTYH